jgi:2-dehydro-3-deoxygluconokinase
VPDEPGSEVATLGEALVVLDPDTAGPLRSVTGFTRHFGGAELNVAVALARLGHRSAWSGALGDDELGHAILAFLRGEGVDVRGVRLEPDASTGLYLKERRALDRLQVHYFRTGSAASALRASELDLDRVLAAGMLHITGITPALSDAGEALTDTLTAAARERGVMLSFDANLRFRLLGDRDPRALLRASLERADLIFCAVLEAEALLGSAEPDGIARSMEGLRAEVVVVHDADGALAVERGGAIARTHAHRVTAVDTVGAGDAFVAGFLSGRLRGWGTARCLSLATACGACAVTVPGDAESMPFEGEALSLLPGGATGPER